MGELYVIFNTITVYIGDSSLLVDINWLPDIASLAENQSFGIHWSVDWDVISHVIVMNNFASLSKHTSWIWMVVLIDSSTDACIEFGTISEILNVLWAIFASTIKFSGVTRGGVW